MEINIWTLILDNFHQWNFFKQFYKSSFSNRYFNEQSAHRLPNPRSNPLALLQNETKQKHKKKKEKEKEGRNKNNPSSNKNRNPRRKYKLIRWDKKKTPMHHGLAPVRCNADEAIRILFPPETTLHFPFSSTFSSTFSFSSSLSSEQQNWTWFRHTSEKPATAVFTFSRTLEPEV